MDPDLNPVRQRKILQYNLEKTFKDENKEILNRLGYPLPNELLDSNPDKIKEIYDKVSNDAKAMGYRVGALKRTKNRSEDEKIDLNLSQAMNKNTKRIKRNSEILFKVTLIQNRTRF